MQRLLTLLVADDRPVLTPSSSLDDLSVSATTPPTPPSPAPTTPPSASSPPFLAPSPTPDQRLRTLLSLLRQFSTRQLPPSRASHVVYTLKELAETMVWADQHDPLLWHTFLECATMHTLHQCLIAAETPVEEPPGMYVRKSASEPIPVAPAMPLEKEASVGASSVSNSAQEIRPIAVPSLWSVPRRFGGGIERDEEADKRRVEQLKQRQALALRVAVQAQVLQTLSIIVQSVFRRDSLLCLFSTNHINNILSFPFLFSHDEILAYFMSTVKTTALKLDPALLQLFFNPSAAHFPLYAAVVPFFDHPDRMVRIAVRNVTLSIYAMGDEHVLRYAVVEKFKYIHKTVDLLVKLCGTVARAFELLLDDGREIRRTRSRTGIFRRSVRVADVAARLEEIENILAYLSDVSTVSDAHLRPLILSHLTARLISPIFRPLSSHASPKAVYQQKRWRIANTNVSANQPKPALPLFDAAARCLLLAYVLIVCRSSRFGYTISRELRRPTPDFDGRTVLHALKAMAADISGTERVTFVSLCAIEAFIRCDTTNCDDLANLKFNFSLQAPLSDARPPRSDDGQRSRDSFLDLAVPDRDDLESRPDQQQQQQQQQPPKMLMTLSEFEAPLTPSNSVPSTPPYTPRSPDYPSTHALARTFSHSSVSNDGERTVDGDGILSAFQLGEASLRETISSVVLVVRRREVRTLRVIHAVVRIIDAVGEKTGNFELCIDVTLVILKELVGVMKSFLKNKRTTIVSIESMFENFHQLAQNVTDERFTPLPLDKLLSVDRAAQTASEFPSGAGKRRRATGDDVIAPVEPEDALILFVMLVSYENTLRRCGQFKRQASLLEQTRDSLLEYGLEDSYLDKREALYNVVAAVKRHGEVG